MRCEAADFVDARKILDLEFERNPTQFSSEDFQGYRIACKFDVAIQLTVRGAVHDRFLDFLERLRADPALVEQYNSLKRQWNGRAMDEYRQAKAAFIHTVVEHR